MGRSVLSSVILVSLLVGESSGGMAPGDGFGLLYWWDVDSTCVGGDMLSARTAYRSRDGGTMVLTFELTDLVGATTDDVAHLGRPIEVMLELEASGANQFGGQRLGPPSWLIQVVGLSYWEPPRSRVRGSSENGDAISLNGSDLSELRSEIGLETNDRFPALDLRLIGPDGSFARRPLGRPVVLTDRTPTRVPCDPRGEVLIDDWRDAPKVPPRVDPRLWSEVCDGRETQGQPVGCRSEFWTWWGTAPGRGYVENLRVADLERFEAEGPDCARLNSVRYLLPQPTDPGGAGLWTPN